MTVAQQLRSIIDKLQSDSGYPYREGDKADPARAFAYGLAIGTLEGALQEWERRMGERGHFEVKS